MGQVSEKPRVQDRYHLQKVRLGEGTFGTVWRGVDRQQSGRTVAVKQVHKSRLAARGGGRLDIRHEIAMMRACAHPNLLQIFETYEDEEEFHLVLEYCECGDFGDRLRERPTWPEPDVACWMSHICSAIRALHGRAVCHRDVKPDNFMVAACGLLKLADFGLATSAPDGRLISQKCGTPAFMAPEVHRLPNRSKGYWLPVDIWGAGVCMYMIMHGGCNPFIKEDTLNMPDLFRGALAFSPALHSEVATALCKQMVEPSQRRRIKAFEALQNPWFHQARHAASCEKSPPSSPRLAEPPWNSRGSWEGGGIEDRLLGQEAALCQLKAEVESLRTTVRRQHDELSQRAPQSPRSIHVNAAGDHPDPFVREVIREVKEPEGWQQLFSPCGCGKNRSAEDIGTCLQ